MLDPRPCPGCGSLDEPAINCLPVVRLGHFALCLQCRWTHTDPAFCENAEQALAAFYSGVGRSGHQSPGVRALAHKRSKAATS